MDHNERNRRHKQNIDARNERRNAQQRSYQSRQRTAGSSKGAAGMRRVSEPIRPTAAGRGDHAPVYDQDHGRTAAPQPQSQKGKKQHVHVTKRDLRRRARRRRMLAVFLVLAAVLAGAVFGVTVLFKVTSITVQNPEGYVQQGAANSVAVVQPDATPEPTAPPDDGQSAASQPDAGADSALTPDDSASSQAAAQPTVIPTATPEPAAVVDTGPYTQLQITSALGVQLGDNLFSFKLQEKEELMALALPLLEQIEVLRRYPNGVIVQVTPAVPTWCTPVTGGWLILSESLKVMEQVTEQPQALHLLLCDAKAAQPGTQLATLTYDRLLAEAQAAAEQQAQSSGEEVKPVDPDSIRDESRVALDELMTALEAAGILDRVTAIDTANPEETAFLYEGRISVLLGTTNQMDYKMEWATTILLNENGKGCSATDMGVLDISHIRTDGTIQPVFRQGSYELPSQKTAAVPETDPEAAEGTDPAASTAAPAG